MEEYRKYNRDISEGLYKDGSIRRPKDYGIRVFPDGGVGNKYRIKIHLKKYYIKTN